MQEPKRHPSFSTSPPSHALYFPFYSLSPHHPSKTETMAEEPQPSNIQEGADLEPVPANAEDRKAAQALSALDAKGDEDASQPKKEVDIKALGEAMKNLEFAQGTAGSKKPASETKKEQEAPKKLVKVDAADVTLLVCVSRRTALENLE